MASKFFKKFDRLKDFFTLKKQHPSSVEYEVTYHYSAWFGFAPVLFDDPTADTPMVVERWRGTGWLLDLMEIFAYLAKLESFQFARCKRLEKPVTITHYSRVD